MERALTKNNNTPQAPATISQTTTAVSLAQRKFDLITKSVGLSVAELLDRPPIVMLKKQLPDDHQAIEAFLAVQINNLMESVNIANNLNIQPYQIPAIAAQLIEMFPVESLEDFVLCFKRGALAFYGTIYKLDASVLCEWMRAYLDEKYSLIESKIKQQQQENTEANEVNYEEFKKRAGEVFKPEKKTNFKENEYQRQKLANPYKYYKVRNLEIYATSQAHAEELVKRMIDRGELEEVKE